MRVWVDQGFLWWPEKTKNSSIARINYCGHFAPKIIKNSYRSAELGPIEVKLLLNYSLFRILSLKLVRVIKKALPVHTALKINRTIPVTDQNKLHLGCIRNHFPFVLKNYQLPLACRDCYVSPREKIYLSFIFYQGVDFMQQ